jgi:hypothetical protein
VKPEKSYGINTSKFCDEDARRRTMFKKSLLITVLGLSLLGFLAADAAAFSSLVNLGWKP